MPKSVDIKIKRSEFVAASVEVIANEGLSAATMRRIASVAGCTTGSLTHYYGNRRELLIDTLRAVHQKAGKRMRELQSSSHSALENLRLVLRESLPLDQERLIEWRVWLAFWSASMDDRTLTLENTRRYREWTQLVETLLAPLVAHEDIRAEAAIVIAFIDGLGVGVARHMVEQKSIRTMQKDCEIRLDDYLKKFGEAP